MIRTTLLVAAVAVVSVVSTGCSLGSSVNLDAELVPPDVLVADMGPLVWTPDPLTGGLLVGKLANDKVPIERLIAPWTKGEPEPGLSGSYPFFVTDPTGNFLLANVESPQSNSYRFLNWDRSAQKLVAEVSSDSSSGVFNRQSDSIAFRERESTRIVSATTGRVIGQSKELASGSLANSMAWSPNGDLLLGQYGAVTILEKDTWTPKVLKTASRDLAEWEAKVARGEEESGYHPHENVGSLMFTGEGEFLICTMDRGLRVFRWKDVENADTKLPRPVYAVDSELVRRGWSLHRMTYAAAYDPERQLILWGGLETTLHLLDLKDGSKRTLFDLPEGLSITRLALLPEFDVLCCEVTDVHGQSTKARSKLLLLDYRRVLDEGVASDQTDGKQ